MNTSNLPLKEAIVGCAFNYSTEAITPFLNSLERSGFTGDLLLFINNHSQITASGYSYRVLLINPDVDFAPEIKRVRFFNRILQKTKLHRLSTPLLSRLVLSLIRRNQNLRKWLVAHFYQGYNLMTARFFLYYYYLHPKAYSRILFSDVTDVIFQGNPLVDIDNDKVYAYSENPDFRIGNNPNNRGWIQKAFGEKVLQRMANEPIYCAGTIIAGRDIVLHFLKDFMENVLQYKVSPYTEGIDQGVFNFMISYQQKPYFDLHRNGDHVLTLALQPVADIVDQNGKIYLRGKDAIVPCIVHQYNRHDVLIAEINKRFQTP
ncbi:MAG TPA: hypothetical protein VGN63_01885 [Flavisolibacter sp.]|jgi:hypothetical protein|nr:hypothetical protein [Flavisolibacter sp.]